MNIINLKTGDLCKTPVAALCERRRTMNLQENHGGHRPPLQPKAGFAEISNPGVAARECKERKARQMNDENEDHKNGGWGNLQIPSSLCPLRSFAAVQFRNSGLT
jgi:hypothetical protein